jgi:hypothetical protein
VDLLREVHATLRDCGGGRRECVCYVAGPLDQPGTADLVLHPRHRASAGGYEVDPAWLDRAWAALGRDGREIRLQVHTHPGAAYHSTIDDTYPLVRTPGFLSLVVPAFAAGSRPLDGAFLAELDERGGCRPVAVTDRLVIR